MRRAIFVGCIEHPGGMWPKEHPVIDMEACLPNGKFPTGRRSSLRGRAQQKIRPCSTSARRTVAAEEIGSTDEARGLSKDPAPPKSKPTRGHSFRSVAGQWVEGETADSARSRHPPQEEQPPVRAMFTPSARHGLKASTEQPKR